jgi:hypothetical protein
MPLEAGAEGELPCLMQGKQEITMGKVALLGLQGEVDAAQALYLLLRGDLEDRLTGGEGIQTQKLLQLFGTGGTVGIDIGFPIPAEGGSMDTGESDMMYQRKSVEG